MADEKTQVQDIDVFDGMENVYLIFNAGNESYGIEAQYITQIVKMSEMSSDMKGFINLSGSVIPVISMSPRFKEIKNAYTERVRIVIVMVGEEKIGIIVDAIQRMVVIEPESISSFSDTCLIRKNPYVKGIAKPSNSCVAVLLDAQKLFSRKNG